jgi:hypothetical protein
MKIYSIPEEVPAPKVDYSNYNHQQVESDEKNHMEDLKNHLIGLGYVNLPPHK